MMKENETYKGTPMRLVLLTKDGCKNCTVFGAKLDEYGIYYEVQRIDSVEGQVIAFGCGLGNSGSIPLPQLLAIKDGTMLEPYIIIKKWVSIPTKEEIEMILNGKVN